MSTSSIPLSKLPSLKPLPLLHKPKPMMMQKKRLQSVSPSRPISKGWTAVVNDDDNQHQHQHLLLKQNSTKKRTKVQLDQDLSWMIGETIDSLKEAPLFHVSPFTSTTIKGNELSEGKKQPDSPNQIAARIVKFVSSLDVTGDYDSEKGCATIRTMDGVTFTIQIFKTQDHQDMIIDIERRKGDTIHFHHVAYSILSILEGVNDDDDDDVSQQQESQNQYNIDNASDYYSHQHYDKETSEFEMNKIKFEEAMESVCTLLDKDRFDAILLGLESLNSMTNGVSSNEDITNLCVQAILKDGEWQIAKDFIFDLLQNGDDKDDKYNDEDSKSQQIEEDYTQQMKQCALKIVANCFSYVAKRYPLELRQILNEKLSECKEISRSQRNLNANLEFQDTFQAAKCIDTLVSTSADMRLVALNSNALQIIAEYQQKQKSDEKGENPDLHEVMKILAETFSDSS